MKLILGGYHQAGLEVLRLAAANPLVNDIALFTHESAHGVPNLEHEAKKLGIWSTTGRLGEVDPPFAADIVSLVYYRHIVPRSVIDGADGRIFNAHPSLLPRHRGCSSVPWAIMDGDSMTGVTYHYVDCTIDTGRIILQSTLSISDDETAASLYRRCMGRTAELWPAAFLLVAHGYAGTEQEGPSTYHRRGAPHGGEISPEWSDELIARFIRAMVYPPARYATYFGHEVATFEEFLQLRESFA